MKLYGYFRSTAAWRVRIALHLKGIAVEHAFRHLRKGEQRSPEFLALNPQGLVPALQLDDGALLTQSLAICEYLEETVPGEVFVEYGLQIKAASPFKTTLVVELCNNVETVYIPPKDSVDEAPTPVNDAGAAYAGTDL